MVRPAAGRSDRPGRLSRQTNLNLFEHVLAFGCVRARFRVRPTGVHIFMKNAERGMFYNHTKNYSYYYYYYN